MNNEGMDISITSYVSSSKTSVKTNILTDLQVIAHKPSVDLKRPYKT